MSFSWNDNEEDHIINFSHWFFLRLCEVIIGVKCYFVNNLTSGFMVYQHNGPSMQNSSPQQSKTKIPFLVISSYHISIPLISWASQIFLQSVMQSCRLAATGVISNLCTVVRSSPTARRARLWEGCYTYLHKKHGCYIFTWLLYSQIWLCVSVLLLLFLLYESA